MNIYSVLTSILNLIAGIGIFVLACSAMSSNLESLSSDKLKDLFSKVSNNKLIGVLMGVVGTAAIQSSGATMVMIIGFVNAGIMSLAQATTIMYGSDIGTTLTAQIVALGLVSGDGVSATVTFSALTGIGVLISSISKEDKNKKIGGILSGFGMLFIGLDMMSSAMESFALLGSVKQFLASISNPVILVIIGAAMTAIIQSSSVMTSLSITMVFAGLIGIDQGIYITMGANIGSCVVGVIAGLTSGTNAKRTSFIQLVYNIGGVVFFMLIGEALKFITNGQTYGTLLEKAFPGSPEVQLAMFHSGFNIISAIICLPLTEALVKLSKLAILERDDETISETEHLSYIDKHMLKTPSIAVEQVKKEIINMSSIALENFNRAIDAITNVDISEKQKFEQTENNINCINHELTNFVSELSRLVVNERDSKYLSKTYHSIIDCERIGDYAENIFEYTQDLYDKGCGFSKDALFEISSIANKVNELYETVIVGYKTNDISKVYDASLIEDEIDDMASTMNVNHIDRLDQGLCGADLGAKFISIASDIERIADHLINVSKTIS